MQRETELVDALSDDYLGYQVVLNVTYRYLALDGSFVFPLRDALLLHEKLFLP
jgi:hypothetical protein